MLKDKTHLFSWKDLTIQVQISHPHPFKVQILHLWAWRTVKCMWAASGGGGGGGEGGVDKASNGLVHNLDPIQTCIG